MTRMTMRDRMLALIQGRPHDRVPFAQYTGQAPKEEAWDLVGRENVGLLQWTRLHALDAPNCRFDTEDIEAGRRKGFRRTLHTPEGDLFEERIYEPAYGSSAAACHFVKEPADYHALLAYLRDVRVRRDLSGYQEAERALGDDGLPHAAVDRTPFQQLWVQWVCLEDLCLHMVDAPGVMEEVFAVLEDIQRRTFRVVRDAAAQVSLSHVDFPDNITAPVIGPTYFERYCVRGYNELADMLADAGARVPLFSHTDGDLKPLWDLIAESKLDGLDSLSPPPDNDTSAAQAAAMWPEMRLWVNFPSSVHLAPPDRIYDTAMDLLRQAGHSGRLQIQISENIPAERWRVSFPQIVRAIRDFGPV